MSSQQALHVGVDIGALYVKGVLADQNGHVVARSVRAHRGEIFKVTRRVIDDLPGARDSRAVGMVGQNAARVAELLGVQPANEVASVILAVRRAYPRVRQIIDIGGGSLSLIEIDEQGEFAGYQTNTMCAAGTGSFLDEQAARLEIAYEDLGDMPEVLDPPSVAARCAVFAKSDLIHRQQEGYSKPQMWSGLAKGLARTIVMTLFKGSKPKGQTVVVGGVARNRDVMRWLGEELSGECAVMEHPQEAGALGAAMLARPAEHHIPFDALDAGEPPTEKQAIRKPLELHKSQYPSFDVEEFYIDDEANEVRVSRWPADGHLRGYLGIDIGSTSTKVMMIGDDEQPLVDVYRKTGGDPIGATKAILRALNELAQRRGGTLTILGAGTTGSGRKLVGSVTRADRVVNEITAHVTGAMKVDPAIDTIFEIGGQDAKYVHTVNGHLHNANMNYVCAAGTGSFVEELSRKMGFDLFTLGDEVMGVTAPLTSDRCTVFMDQDARMLLRKGYSPTEVMGAVMYSVVQNYLNKVVGNRYYNKKKVFFQGATARNKGLVAAFENLLDIEVVVSPYCHVMGSWGVALLTKRQMEQARETTSFAGVAFADAEVKLSSEPCELCANRCAITYAEVAGLDERPSWGYLCGRDAEEQKVRVNREFRFFRQRDRLWKNAGGDIALPADAPVIGYPRALLAHSYFPLWRAFFASLGFRLQLSDPTDARISEQAGDWVGGDYCHPVKLAHGHMRNLLETKKVQRVFVPYMIHAVESEKTSKSFFCPYNIALPAMMRSAMELNGVDGDRLLSATLDMRWDAKTTVERLTEDLGARLGASKKQVAAAWKHASESYGAFEQAMAQAGRKAMEEVAAEGRPAVVILGRPYNIYDAGANLALPEKIARLGFTVLPLEFLPLEAEDLGNEFHNMYWNFGRKIMEAARIIARTSHLYGVYFSNFSCGPDSFIQTYAEEVMGEKPLLMLELDEHGADAGYMTRLEAYADVLAVNETTTVPRYTFKTPSEARSALKGKTLWIPPMGELQPRLMAAAIRGGGVEARMMPLETEDAFVMGRGGTRGGECVPCPATLGAFLSAVMKEGGDPDKHAMFMPTAEGPCRFGQYCTLDRMIFNRMGWKELPIVSWSSSDSYDGTDAPTRRWVWTGIVLGDVLFKMRCRILPYEKNPGETEALFDTWAARLDDAIEKRVDLKPLVRQARDEFMAIPVSGDKKPLVGIVGEIYVRNNRFTNQNLVRRIEAAGGEAWLAPISEWVIYTAYMESWMKGYRTGSWLNRMGNMLKNRFLVKDEEMWTDLVSPILDERHEPSIAGTLEEGARFVPLDFEGETILTLGRAIEFMKGGASLVVNCAPFGCMPGAVTGGVFQQIQREYGVPVANMFYDGEGDINDIIATYIVNIARSDASSLRRVAG